MRILMVAVGSTGDVRPYIGLGTELLRRGHEVTLCAFSEFEQAAQDAGLTFASLYGDAKAVITQLMDGSTGVQFLEQARQALKSIILPFVEDIEANCSNKDVLISTYLGEVFQAIAEAHHIAYIQTQFFPADECSDMPISSAPGQNWGRHWNVASYRIGNTLISALERAYLSEWRVSRELPKRRIRARRQYSINGHEFPVLYAVSPSIMPRPQEWGDNIHITGFWHTLETVDYIPDPALEAFLQNGPAPLYVGFGSMGAKDTQQAADLVLKGLKKTGQRAVLAKGWGSIAGEQDENWFYADFVPHAWLFPRVAAVIHHGGAGTTAAGLLAGKPTLIISFGGDQPFWGSRVHAIGAGPVSIPRKRLSVKKLTEAMTELTANESYRINAEAISRKMQQENGIGKAADLIEETMKSW